MLGALTRVLLAAADSAAEALVDEPPLASQDLSCVKMAELLLI